MGIYKQGLKHKLLYLS